MIAAGLSENDWAAVGLSLKVAAASAAVLLPIGVALGWLLARKRFVGRTLLDAAVHLPLVLPPVVVGYVLLMGLGRNGPIGSRLEDWFGVRLAFTWWAAVIASAVMALPLMVRPIRLAIEMVDERLEQAAGTLGASPMRVWWTVTLPLAMPGVVIGGLLGFARSLGEFGATIVFAGNIAGQTRTLPSAIYTAVQVPGGEGAAWRLVVVSVALSLATVLASELISRRVRRMAGLI